MRGYYVLIFLVVFSSQAVSVPYNKAGVLMLTKRMRPRLGFMDYFILGKSDRTQKYGAFVAPISGDEAALDTAARAFSQAIDSEYSLCMDEQKIRNFISLSNGNTKHVIENQATRSVIFITRFHSDKIKSFKKRVLKADLNEIDELAMVRWENVELAVVQGRSHVFAHIISDEVCLREPYREIELSAEFIDAVKPFFKRMSYEVGDDRRMRIYH